MYNDEQICWNKLYIFFSIGKGNNFRVAIKTFSLPKQSTSKWLNWWLVLARAKCSAVWWKWKRRWKYKRTKPTNDYHSTARKHAMIALRNAREVLEKLPTRQMQICNNTRICKIIQETEKQKLSCIAESFVAIMYWDKSQREITETESRIDSLVD